MSFTAAGSWFATLTFAPTSVGNLFVAVIANNSNATVTCTALTHSSINWTLIGHNAGTNVACDVALFIGTVTSTGSATISETWSGTTPTSIGVSLKEYSVTSGQWIVDTTASVEGTSDVWPAPTSYGSNELYFGGAEGGTRAMVAGSTSGYTYFIDPGSNGRADNPSYSGTAPAWSETQPNPVSGMVALLREPVPAGSKTLTVTATQANSAAEMSISDSFGLTWTQAGSTAGATSQAVSGTMGMTVKVFTGASGVGATGVNSGVGVISIAITPQATGSYIVGTNGDYPGGTAPGPYTWLSNTTGGMTDGYLNNTDAVQFSCTATWRSATTTTTTSSTTFGGASLPNSSGSPWIAAAEIKGTSLTEDASSPPPVFTHGATNITTASFSPPSGSLLVVMVSANNATAGSGSIWTASVPSNFQPTFFPQNLAYAIPGEAVPGLIIPSDAANLPLIYQAQNEDNQMGSIVIANNQSVGRASIW